MITFESVTKRFPDGTVAVDNLDLELPTGKITVFVGPSGCGKTTSLRMINRMIEPSMGRVLIDGDDVGQRDPAQLRLGIGYVIQQAGLFPHRTVVDNIATVPNLIGWPKAKARERARELMDRVGLDRELGRRYPIQLSGGQQQRVGVARALAADPPVMLMDEPFSAVDPVVRGNLQQEFLRLQSELDKTIAFVTHDIDEAVKIGDIVAVFRTGGRLAQVDSPQRLLEHPADEFVADFVGRDRGFRGLSFVPADELAVEEPATIREGARRPGRPGGGLAVDDWVLLVDDEERPVGWLDGSVQPRRAARAEHARPLAGTFTQRDPVRLVLDLAITSPAGFAVRVDEDGAVDGVISHESIARQLHGNNGSSVASRSRV